MRTTLRWVLASTVTTQAPWIASLLMAVNSLRLAAEGRSLSAMVAVPWIAAWWWTRPQRRTLAKAAEGVAGVRAVLEGDR